MKAKETFEREVLLNKIDNKNYKIEFKSTDQYSGLVSYQAMDGGGNFKGLYKITEDGLLGDIFITLAIPNVQFVLLNDGDIKSMNTLFIEASKFYSLMENQFLALKGI